MMGKGLLESLGLKRSRPTLEQFRERVIQAIQAGNPSVRVEVTSEDSLETYFPDAAKPGFANIGRAYDWCREHPRDTEQIVQQMARLALYEPPPATPDNLIVLVRPGSFDPGDTGDKPALVRPLPGGLVAIVAVDGPDCYVFSSAEGLYDDLGLDDDAIWDRAFANLRSRLPTAPPKLERGKVVTIETGVGLASSLLAVESFWNHPDLLAAGDLVVLPLEFDQLIYTRADEAELVHSFRRLAASFRTSTSLSDKLLLRRNGRWEDFG